MGPAGSGRRLDRALFLLIFVVVFMSHFVSPAAQTSDAVWNMAVAYSLVTQGNANLDEFEPMLASINYAATEQVDGHYYNLFPIGPSLMAVPFMYVLLKSGAGLTFFNEHGLDNRGPQQNFDILVASILVALASAILFLTVRTAAVPPGAAMLLVFIFAFCTPVWSTASRSLWTHGPSVLMLCLTAFLLLRGRAHPSSLGFTGLHLDIEFICWTTNAISIALLGGWLLVRHRRQFFYFVAWAMPVALPWIAYNLSVYGTALPGYHDPSRASGWNSFLVALPANMISPGRGLLVFCPIFLFSIYGVVLRWKENRLRDEFGIFSGVIFLHWIVHSRFAHWWMGHSYGPRAFTDCVPFLTLLLVPVIPKLQSDRTHAAGRFLLRGVFCAAVLFSFFVHFRGATTNAVHDWNIEPVNIDTAPERVWDWSDPPFLRGL